MKVVQPSPKILIVLMFWEQDKAQAMALARLLADLEDGHSSNADFLFVPRFDCTMDPTVLKYVSRKFNTFVHVSRRRGVGWPNGCNSIFFGGLEWVYHKMASGKVPLYRAVLILGADSAPLTRDWLDTMVTAWEKANKRKQVYVAGAMGEAGGRMHINGDCVLLSGDLKFLRWLAVQVGDVSASAGWDWLLNEEFKRWGWVDFPFVKNMWKKPTFTPAEWDYFRGAGVEWVHGVKSGDLLKLSRARLLK